MGYKESWLLKNWWFWTVVLEKTLESSLDCKEIKPVHPKGNQSLEDWCWSCGQYFCHLMQRTDSLDKTLMMGKIEGRRRRGQQKMTWFWMAEDEMVGWHEFDGLEFEQALGVEDGQGSLVCCSPWGPKILDITEWLNWTELIHTYWYVFV